jgi:ATP-dependent helicase HrpB
VSKQTRIEVMTEGVFTRAILDDPALDGVGAVLFDEFHERSLDADLGLALARDSQTGLRPDLRILVMSATLDGARISSLLGDAPIIQSEGRAFPVTTRYLGRDPHARIEDRMTRAIEDALATESGSILAFLPGQAEIRRTAERLGERVRDPNVDIAPLYGAMDQRAQDLAVQPAVRGRRKVVLATSIAETSLTIEGVRVVVDSGLARVPRYEPDVGVTRLETMRVSRAAADQRRGRAGRTEPGVCFRLWDEPETQALPAFAEPEIRSADLTGLLLDCATWGVTDPASLTWLDPPPTAALAAARDELATLGALDADGRITDLGRRLGALPLPARLAAMVERAAGLGAAPEAAEIAAVLVERGLGGSDTDLDQRLANFRRERGGRAGEMRRLAEGWARTADRGAAPNPAKGLRPLETPNVRSAASVLALAYPDRIAKARGAAGQYLLANGRAAVLDPTDALAKSDMLVVAELSGRAAATRILLAARLDAAELAEIAGEGITTTDDVTFDSAAGALRCRRVSRLGAITLTSETKAVPADEASARLLAEAASRHGLDRLGWSKPQRQLRDRAAFLRAAGLSDVPDLSGAALGSMVHDWLAPYLTGVTSLGAIDAELLGQALDALVPWAVRQRLDADAPTHFTAPTGMSHAIDYDGENAPALHIRVQELFGLSTHPSVAGGRLPLTLYLLSPAHRPIQITKDLPGFWAGSWKAVKAEMKGRYPRHPWPDDPTAATPTTRAKPRGT